MLAAQVSSGLASSSSSSAAAARTCQPTQCTPMSLSYSSIGVAMATNFWQNWQTAFIWQHGIFKRIGISQQR